MRAAVGVSVAEISPSDDCEQGGGTDCRRLATDLGIALAAGGGLALAAGVALVVVGGNRRFADPHGAPMPERGEHGTAPGATVAARVRLGWAGFEGVS